MKELKSMSSKEAVGPDDRRRRGNEENGVAEWLSGPASPRSRHNSQQSYVYVQGELTKRFHYYLVVVVVGV